MAGVSRLLTPEQRLLAKRHIAPNDCWEWTGCLDGKGYGRLRIYGVATRLVPRIAAWVWKAFDLASALQICHHCDNPKCFNPEHLFEGTQSDNIVDCVRKGRMKHRRSGLRNLEKMLCPRGHPYSVENTVVELQGSHRHRKCRMCVRARDRERWHRRRQKEVA